jgi:hypothetical protein
VADSAFFEYSAVSPPLLVAALPLGVLCGKIFPLVPLPSGCGIVGITALHSLPPNFFS